MWQSMRIPSRGARNNESVVVWLSWGQELTITSEWAESESTASLAK